MTKKWTVLSALALGLAIAGAALARDSARFVCSGIAEFDDKGVSDKIGISIDFFDARAEGGNSRKYTLSSIYQSKLFQGTMIDRSADFGQGKISLKNARSELFVGSFKLEKAQDDSYTMVLDGKINNDPTSSKTLYPLKARLPCVDLSI
jgi:hypothetical protein